MKRISLTQGKFALVDNADFDWLNQWKWTLLETKNVCYAYRTSSMKNNRKRQSVLMHREILGLKFKSKIKSDHRNHNGLDNRRCNLRKCTISQNLQNQLPIRKRKTKFKGVYRPKYSNKYHASITHKRKFIYLGCFDNEIEAAKRYDMEANKLFGEFAYLNFPN